MQAVEDRDSNPGAEQGIWSPQPNTTRTERVKRGLMVWCALILFVLGVWLLLEPLEARGAQKMDNVMAISATSLDIGLE